MDNFLSGLESMGLGKMANIDLFEENKEEQKKEEAKQLTPEMKEADLILDKGFKCTLCDNEFKAKIVKTGKSKLLSQDLDLRPRYMDIDALKYGVTVCPKCGYAAMAKAFPVLMPAQAKLIKEQISSSFTGLGPEGIIYTYDDAIMRHKLALVNTVVKRAKTSERAYTCLLIAWLLRGKRESLSADMPDYEDTANTLKREEIDFLAKAKMGFEDAFEKENFPMWGLDENTTIYLIAALCAETGATDEALRWASRLITAQGANDRIKERARNIRDMIANGEI